MHRWVLLRKFVPEPGRFLTTARVAQEAVDVKQPWSGDDPLPAHVAEFPAQMNQHLGLQLVARSEVGVTALAGERSMGFAVPMQTCLTKSGACGDNPLISGCLGAAFIQTR